jgi:glyceraldehyde 3-phosphate dehydrogenase
MDPKYLVYLLKYDSVHGRFNGTVELKGNDLVVNGKTVKLTHEMAPEKTGWGGLGVDYVAECTGVFTKAEACKKHLASGAKKVIISAPPSTRPQSLL